MTEQEAVALFKCLADRTRLQILRTLAREDAYVELLSERLGMAPSTISFHLKKLADVGAVSSSKAQYYTMYTLNRELFDKTMLSILQEESDEAAVQDERERLWREKVLRSFFDEDGRLRTIPAQRKKRLIVLEKLAEAFEPGHTYTEREVNLIIADVHDDFATLRRDLVDERFMTRENGQYQRMAQ
ncbi:MAG: metalloregulator ArsR/SmtB family transcription factor [Atopobiaceae bacterium]|nr:metalloregulator ArsR/SmtB family transcription factor [Atopobiaceae bacterium]MBQ9620985.1 metalloregulator ArsR/SmtB family transcription factor [Atopobiaceae bacterium]